MFVTKNEKKKPPMLFDIDFEKKPSSFVLFYFNILKPICQKLNISEGILKTTKIKTALNLICGFNSLSYNLAWKPHNCSNSNIIFDFTTAHSNYTLMWLGLPSPIAKERQGRRNQRGRGISDFGRISNKTCSIKAELLTSNSIDINREKKNFSGTANILAYFRQKQIFSIMSKVVMAKYIHFQMWEFMPFGNVIFFCQWENCFLQRQSTLNWQQWLPAQGDSLPYLCETPTFHWRDKFIQNQFTGL